MFFEKRHAIIEPATRLFDSIGFDATTTLEIAEKAGVTEPLIYYHFKGKDELFTHSLDLAFDEYISRPRKLPNGNSTDFQKFVCLINLHFQIVDDLPDIMRLILSAYPAKLYDPTDVICDHIASVYQENSPERIYFLILYNIFSEFLDDIDEDVLPNDRTDAFEEFIRDRASNLLDLIEIATGKKVSGRDSDEVVHEYGAKLKASEQTN